MFYCIWFFKYLFSINTLETSPKHLFSSSMPYFVFYASIIYNRFYKYCFSLSRALLHLVFIIFVFLKSKCLEYSDSWHDHLMNDFVPNTERKAVGEQRNRRWPIPSTVVIEPWIMYVVLLPPKPVCNVLVINRIWIHLKAFLVVFLPLESSLGTLRRLVSRSSVDAQISYMMWHSICM